MGSGKETESDVTVRIGKYTIIRPLGQGGEGCVYLARDEALQRLVAVKKIYGEPVERTETIIEDEEICRCGDRISQTVKEADFLKRLQHPMLPVVHDLLREDTFCYLVMEYVRGITLHEYIGRNGYVEKETACVWAGQLLDILEYLHTRKPPVVYRDLKPDNIMVCPDGRLKLIDFGAAVQRDFGGKEDRLMAATPGYGAPEQFGQRERERTEPDRQGNPAAAEYCGRQRYADERSDIYAFGKVLYYIVTGAEPAKPPYTSLHIQDYQSLIPDRMERVIRKCIQENPAARYQVVGEIRRDLDRCRAKTGRLRRGSFIRAVEKQVWLTEM